MREAKLPAKSPARPRPGSLLWRLFVTNAAVVLLAAVLLVVTPVTISAPISLEQLVLIGSAVVVMLGANLLLLTRALSPLHELTALMRTVDPLEPGRRLEEVDHADIEVAMLAEAFNAMLDRLESRTPRQRAPSAGRPGGRAAADRA